VWPRRIGRFHHGEGPRFLTATLGPRFTSPQLLRIRLRLFESEEHLHLAVHRSRGDEALSTLLALTCSPRERAEADVAVVAVNLLRGLAITEFELPDLRHWPHLTGSTPIPMLSQPFGV